MPFVKCGFISPAFGQLSGVATIDENGRLFKQEQKIAISSVGAWRTGSDDWKLVNGGRGAGTTFGG
jgi:microcompartment protein CcmK/EutM